MLAIFHLTDPHARVGVTPHPDPRLPGFVRPDRDVARETYSGLAALDALLEEELAALPPDASALLVCCGDLFAPEVPLDRDTEGHASVEALRLLARHRRLDAALWLVGNHEMDHGIARLMALPTEAQPWQVLATNLRVDGAPLSSGAPLQVGPYRLAVLPLTALQTATEAPFADQPRLAVTAPVVAGRAHRVAPDTDLTLVLAHTWDEEDRALGALPGVDLVLGGHTHVLRSERLPTGARYEKAGCHAEVLGRVWLRPGPRGLRIDELHTALLPLDVPPPSDSPFLALEARVEGELDRSDPRRLTRVARLPEPILGLRALRTAGPSALGEAAARGVLLGIRRHGPVHCVALNAGNLRASLHPRDGAASLASLHSALPYPNELVLVELSPDGLRRLLWTAALNLKLDRSGWLRVAGLHARIGPDGAPGSIAVESPDGGLLPLRHLPTLTLCTFDFLALEDGHGYGFLADSPLTRTGLHPADVWAEGLHPDELLPCPPLGLSVDDGFRQTDTRTMLANAESAFPHGFPRARARVAALEARR